MKYKTELRKMLALNLNDIGTSNVRSNKKTTMLHALLSLENATNIGWHNITKIEIECNKGMIADSNSSLNILMRTLDDDQSSKIKLVSTIKADTNILHSNGSAGYMSVDAKITTKNTEHIFLFKQESSSINKNSYNYLNATMGEILRLGKSDGSRKISFISVTPNKTLSLSKKNQTCVIESVNTHRINKDISSLARTFGVSVEKIVYDVDAKSLDLLLKEKNLDFAINNVLDYNDITNIKHLDILT